MKRITFLFIILMTTVTLSAQLTLNGEYRPRIDFDHGIKTLQTQQNQMFNLNTSQRARMGLFYKADKYNFGLQIQDVRRWGSTSQLVQGDGAFTTIHQAWGEVLFGDNVKMKLGRQELVYDDSRILGNVDWALQARSHDLALFKYEVKNGIKVHFGLAVNQVQTIAYNTSKNYKSMQFLWINKSFGDLKVSFLALNNGVDDVILNNASNSPTTTYSQIVGLRPIYKAGKFTFSANAYYQMGKSTATYTGKDDNKQHHVDIAAYNFRFDAAYKVTDNLKATIGVEMLSGNSETDQDSLTNTAFSPLYGTNHKFNGWMDYFYVGNHANTVGLNDMFLMLDYSKNKLLLGAHFHYFMANADVLDMDKSTPTDFVAMDAALGMELDTYVGYKYSKGLTFKVGMSAMFDTQTLRAIKTTATTAPDNGASNYYGWMMMIMKPTFLNGK